MACVDSLINSIIAGCNATQKIGGVAKAVWIATIDDIASVTLGTGNAVTAITFKADKGFIKLSGKDLKNSGATALEVGENFNLRTHTVTIPTYWATAADLEAIDQLIDQELVMVIVETRAGALEVYGLNKVNFSAYGLKVSASDGTTGVAAQDSTATTIVLSGGMSNLQLLYNPAVILATNKAALDALVVEPA